MENEDKPKPDDNCEPANAASPRPTRRQFLKGLTTGTVAIGALSQAGCAPAIPPLKTRGATNTTTVCPFCGVGCGQVVSTLGGKVINIEGDPGHPISEGTLCSKGAAGIQVVNNSRRLQKVLYRKPNGAAWEEKSWDWALERIAAEIHRLTRARRTSRPLGWGFLGRCLGGSALDNEEAYLLVKLMRSLGLVYVEHQARL